ncbi:MAG: hypothetical protein PVG78_07890 [Desulfobacterales bacterium]|jgi:hypothetical protein
MKTTVTCVHHSCFLPDLGGGMKLLCPVRPAAFVPVHGFGDTAIYAHLDSPCDPDRTRIFHCRQPGDQMRFAL